MKQPVSQPTKCQLACVLALTVFANSAESGDWRQFRGNMANSVAVGENLPTELSGGSIAWKVKLPGRGVASPIVMGDQVVLTASSGYSQDRLHIMSFDGETGETQWERQLGDGPHGLPQKNECRHSNSCKRRPANLCLLFQQRFDLHRSFRRPTMVSRSWS